MTTAQRAAGQPNTATEVGHETITDNPRRSARCLRAALKDFPEVVRKAEEAGVSFDPTYMQRHKRRFAATLSRLPTEGSRILDVGGHPDFDGFLRCWDPALRLTTTDYPGRRAGQKLGQAAAGVEPPLLFDCERDPFPVADGSMDGVLLMEVLEHLVSSPSHCLAEIHRVLKPGGWLLLTTPNILSWKHVLRALAGIEPLEFSTFVPDGHGGSIIQHAKEFTPLEVRGLLLEAGFETVELSSPTVSRERRLTVREFAVLPLLWLASILLLRHPKHFLYRGEKTFAVAYKAR